MPDRIRVPPDSGILLISDVSLKDFPNDPIPMKHALTTILAGLGLCLNGTTTCAAGEPLVISQAAQLLAMSLEELGQVKISTPTGRPAPIAKAAAVATVITADDIKAMGSNDLMTVLESVPGLHVGRTEQANLRKIQIRGITSSYNPQTLVLLNSIPLTSNFTGNRSSILGSMPLKSIERIEVIRGPGSALYGADAYAGVINIITKTPGDLLRENNGPVAKTALAAGSFDTRGAWLQTASTANEIDAGIFLEYQTTDGHREKIAHDAQTNLDQIFNTSASLAPGATNNMVDETLLRMELTGTHWRFRSGYQYLSNVGTGAGIGFALDPHGRYAGYRTNADYSYFFNDLADDLEIESRVSFLRTEQRVEESLWLYPPGAFAGAFPEGFSGNPGYKEDQARYDLSALYKGVEDHWLRVGAGIYWGDMFEVMLKRNFMTLPNGRPAPRPGGMTDVSDTDEAFLPEAQRDSKYALLQDEWSFARDWQLTSGVRIDDYSDFGTTTNPRFALIWDTSPILTTKLLFGRAFRSPSFAELYTNSSIQIGNPDLGPETIDTWEIAASVQPTPRFSYGVNLFRYSIHDFITAIPRAGSTHLFFSNVGDRTGNGGELEFSWIASDRMKLLGNYSYTHAIDDATGEQVGEFPAHQLYSRLDWQFLAGWTLSPQANYIGKQERIALDTRDPVDAYTTLDLTLRQVLNRGALEWSVSVLNLLDEEVREPSPYGNPVSIPDDFPAAGRALMSEITFSF